MKTNETLRQQRIIRLAALIGTIGTLFILFWTLKMAPFGNSSLAREDANIQYLAFFSYLKDVFRGENSLWYSLSIGLGGSGVPLASYYLSSPFNLLLFLFPKTELHSFVDITVALKLGVCAWTFCYYLQKRFPQLDGAKTLALSFCFALMQYNIAQSSNLMWLDGIYMLPLILLGVYRLVSEGRIGPLAAAFAVCLILNWYIAAINALFSVGMLILEWIWEEKREPFFKTLLRFIRAGIRSLLISAWVVVPTVAAQLRGKGSTTDWTGLSLGWLGNMADTLRNYRIWSINLPGAVTWFCGGLALLGTVAFFFSRQIPVKKKISGGAALIMLNLCYYWIPLFILFSLGKEPQGHWCRYAYLGSTLLLFLTAEALQSFHTVNEKPWKSVLLAAVTAVAVLVILNWNGERTDQNRLLITLAFLVVAAALLILSGRERKGTKVWVALLPILMILEMGWNASGLMRFYASPDVEEYREYVMDQTDRIDAITQSDPSVYRIGQTSYRRKEENGLTACFDESMAYGFASNTGYTSYSDASQLDFLNSLGYRTEAESMNIADTAILPADSLLGVRYILSEYDIPGLELMDEPAVTDNKKIYRNPYAFPMAFTTQNMGTDMEGEDPFQYQNRLIRELTGIEEDVFVPAEWSVEQGEDTRTYTVRKSREDSLLYGSLPWEGEQDWMLTAGDSVPTHYACWLSPSVFYIPAQDASAVVEVRGEVVQDIQSPYFYEMRPEVLQRAASVANERSASLEKAGGRSFVVSCSSEQEGFLYINIPYSADWTIRVNGEIQKAESYGGKDPMVTVPVNVGENLVEMSYHVKGLWLGILITMAECLLLIVFFRKRKK